MALILNTINVFFIIWFALRQLKKNRDTSIFWFIIIALYFYVIPLLFDSIMIFFYGQERWGAIIHEYNKYFDVSFISSINIISLHALIFNIIVILSYSLVNPNSNKKAYFPKFHFTPSEKFNYFFPWGVYILICYIGFALFLYRNGITSISRMSFQWYNNARSGSLLTIIVSFLTTMSPLFLLRSLYDKNIVYTILLIIPILLIGYVTTSRALIISVAFFVLYYFIWKNSNKKISTRTVVTFVILAFCFTILLSFFRGAHSTIYPLYRDVSYGNLFYVYQHQTALSTHGHDFIRLILTGFYDYDAYDITEKIADYRFSEGWGTLHPTVLGWAYVDLGNYFFVFCLFYGLFIGICDRVKYLLPVKFNFMFDAFIFSFIAISVRGSVQYAYAKIIYPLLIMLILLLIIKYARIKI